MAKGELVNQIIVLISGRQGSGKNTLANELRHQLEKFNVSIVEYSFAKVLYQMHDEVLKVMSRYNEVPKKDGRLLQLLGTEWGRNIYGSDVWVNVVKKEMHQAALLADSVSSRKYISIGNMDGKSLEGNVHVITDCRFKNELSAFPEAIKIRLECAEEIRKERILKTPGQSWREGNHQSERDLDDHTGWDLVFHTDKSSSYQCAEVTIHNVYNGILKKLRIV